MLLILQPHIQDIITMDNITQFLVTSTTMTCRFITNDEENNIFYMFKMISCEVHAPV